jgi:hypothetical protein
MLASLRVPSAAEQSLASRQDGVQIAGARMHSPIFSSRLTAVWPELSTSPDQLSLPFVISPARGNRGKNRD